MNDNLPKSEPSLTEAQTTTDPQRVNARGEPLGTTIMPRFSENDPERDAIEGKIRRGWWNQHLDD